MHAITCLPTGTSFEIQDEPILGPDFFWIGTDSGYNLLGPFNNGSTLGDNSFSSSPIPTNHPECFDLGGYPTTKAFNTNYYTTEPPLQLYPISSVDGNIAYSTTMTTEVQPDYSYQDSYPTMKGFNTNYCPTDSPSQSYPLFPVHSVPATPSSMTPTSIPASVNQGSLCSPISPITGPSPGSTSIPCFAHGCDGRSFSSLGNYRRHMREKARRAKTFPCSMCGKVFTRSTARNMHQKTTKCLENSLGLGVEATGGLY